MLPRKYVGRSLCHRSAGTDLVAYTADAFSVDKHCARSHSNGFAVCGTFLPGFFVWSVFVALSAHGSVVDEHIVGPLLTLGLATMHHICITDSSYCWHVLSSSILAVYHPTDQVLRAPRLCAGLL